MESETRLRLQKKKRNLEKRKNKIEELKLKEKDGVSLNNEQLESLTNYGAVLAQIELINELLSSMKVDVEKCNRGTEVVNGTCWKDNSKSTQTEEDLFETVYYGLLIHEKFLRVMQCLRLGNVLAKFEQSYDAAISQHDLVKINDVSAVLLPHGLDDGFWVDDQLAGMACETYLESSKNTYKLWSCVLNRSDKLVTETLSGREAFDLLEKFSNSSVFRRLTIRSEDTRPLVPGMTCNHTFELTSESEEKKFVASLANQGPYSFVQPVETGGHNEVYITKPRVTNAADIRIEGVLSNDPKLLYNQQPGMVTGVLHGNTIPGMNVYTSDSQRVQQNIHIGNRTYDDKRESWHPTACISDNPRIDSQDGFKVIAFANQPKQDDSPKSWAAIAGPSGTTTETCEDVFSQASLWKNPETNSNTTSTTYDRKQSKSQYQTKGYSKFSGSSRGALQGQKDRRVGNYHRGQNRGGY